MDLDFESTQTGYLYLGLILTLILSLLCIITVLVISSLAYMADEELQLLFEMPEIDSRIYRQELREIKVLLPFCIQVGVCFLNFYLITSEPKHEIWMYVKPGFNMQKVITILICAQMLVSLVFAHMWARQPETKTHHHHVLSNVITLMQLVMMQASAISRVNDVQTVRAGNKLN